jgi:outer membrane protein TolC
VQADQAKRTAEIARLTFKASLRDTRAAVETAYYQVLLDYALISVNSENIDNLRQVVGVTKAAYAGGQHTQADVINAQIALAQAEVQQRQYETNRANDEASLNQLLFRKPAAPLELDHSIHLQRLEYPLDKAIDLAVQQRQEILEAALTEQNSAAAIKLAQLEYLPSYSIGTEYDTFLEPGTQPEANVRQGWSFTVGFSMPIFFWIHQREDVTSARYSLEAARANLESVKLQTETSVTQLHRSSQLGYEQAQLYADSLIPMARQDFKVSLIAYQSGQIDFLTLSAALQAIYSTRASYVQNANQFLAGVVALEQAMGAPLPK